MPPVMVGPAGSTTEDNNGRIAFLHEPIRPRHFAFEGRGRAVEPSSRRAVDETIALTTAEPYIRCLPHGATPDRAVHSPGLGDYPV
jgi:hypothetical protein